MTFEELERRLTRGLGGPLPGPAGQLPMSPRPRFGWKAGLPAYLAASYIGVSRLQENRHYLSDVIFGAAVGIVSGRSLDMRDRTIGIEPFVSSRGAGMNLVIRR